MSRVAITLDEHALAELRKRAQANSEPPSRAAARLIRDGLLSTQATAAEATAPQASKQPSEQSTSSPSWLEPESERERWRRELWAAVVALHERYPRALRSLRENWWQDHALIETLAALAAWRAQLDAGLSEDPRAELLFHDRLTILARELPQAGGSTSRPFKGGPPPTEWTG